MQGTLPHDVLRSIAHVGITLCQWSPLDILSFRRVCMQTWKSIPRDMSTRIVLEEALQRSFMYTVDVALMMMKDYGGVVSGSLVLKMLFGASDDEWGPCDLDIFVPHVFVPQINPHISAEFVTMNPSLYEHLMDHHGKCTGEVQTAGLRAPFTPPYTRDFHSRKFLLDDCRTRSYISPCDGVHAFVDVVTTRLCASETLFDAIARQFDFSVCKVGIYWSRRSQAFRLWTASPETLQDLLNRTSTINIDMEHRPKSAERRAKYRRRGIHFV